jgi:beta-lactam-binding protein with PASTA domain
MDTFSKHQISIARKTLKMTDIGVSVMGGMNKEEAREILKKNGIVVKE